ncbi:chymotrypsin-like serine proteinase [Cimex lectularius]|uniref:Peptidase S1 domain-containing protein n=1 Tax=Cimex lectularius TaxID=79782 RepID=A0A8I6REX3_CIMLE|nr:chymotrypsin-like serine proteinase [Cimex lectularius]
MPKLYFKIFVIFLTITFPYNISCESHGKIKGGRHAKPGEFPFMGLLISPNNEGINMLCGCALVTTTKIVTAGHCLMTWENGRRILNEIEEGEVFFGTIHLKSREGQTSKLKSVKYPKEIRLQEADSVMHDYATAELVTPMVLTDTVKVMQVYSKNKQEFKNGWDELVASKGTCLIIGWGARDFRVENDSFVVTLGASPILKTAVAQPWEEEKCEKYVGLWELSMVPFGEVCLLGVTHGEIILPGDSGSPLMCGDYVWGVCSTMILDDTGTMPFQYLLHWHYLNEFLYPEGAIGSSIRPEISIPLFFIILFLR